MVVHLAMWAITSQTAESPTFTVSAAVSGCGTLTYSDKKVCFFLVLQLGFEKSVSPRGVLLGHDRVFDINVVVDVEVTRVRGLTRTLGLVEGRRLHHGDHSEQVVTSNNVW